MIAMSRIMEGEMDVRNRRKCECWEYKTDEDMAGHCLFCRKPGAPEKVWSNGPEDHRGYICDPCEKEYESYFVSIVKI